LELPHDMVKSKLGLKPPQHNTTDSRQINELLNNISNTYNHLQLDRLNIVQVDLCPDLAVPVEQRHFQISHWNKS